MGDTSGTGRQLAKRRERGIGRETEEEGHILQVNGGESMEARGTHFAQHALAAFKFVALTVNV